MYCSRCDWLNPDGSRFCNQCGTTFDALVPTVRAVRSEPVAPAPVPVDPHLTQRLGGPDIAALALAVEARTSVAIDAPVAAMPAPVVVAPAPIAAAPAPIALTPEPAAVAPATEVVAAAPIAAAPAPIAAAPAPIAAAAAPIAAAPAPIVAAPPTVAAVPTDVAAAPTAASEGAAAPTPIVTAPVTAPRGEARSDPSKDTNPKDASTGASRKSSAKRLTGSDASTVSLAAIGVRSSRKTWALIAGAAMFLLGAGVAAGLVIARPSTHRAVDVAAEELAELDPVPTAAAATLPSALGEAEPMTMHASAPQGRASGGTSRSFQERDRAAAESASAPRGVRVRVPRERAPSGNIAELPPADTSDTPTSRAPDFEQQDPSSPDTPPPWRSDTGAERATSPAPSPAPSTARPATRSRASSSARAPATPSLEDAARDMGSAEQDDLETTMYASRVRSVIRQYYRPRAQTCFDRAARNDPELRGTVLVNFTIGGSGQVRAARVVSNTTNHDEIGRCIVPIVNAWRLPAPPNDEELQIEMPFSR